MKHFLLGTAGHVDHGKSTLIKALTDIDPDRLPEEKARGLSIDLGFAPLLLADSEGASAVAVGVIDVPGHRRYLTNMIAGVGGLDAVMLVVDPTEGVKPQTREHLRILDLLGVQGGLAVLSKADKVDDETLEIARWELEELLQGTCLCGAPILATSAVTGQGLDQLREGLFNLFSSRKPRSAVGLARLPIDRVFSKVGFGTVITGSLWSGTLSEGQEAALIPSGGRHKIRGLQVHGEKVNRAVAGQRVAVNLSGLDRDAIRRGEVLVAPADGAEPGLMFGASFQVLGDVAKLSARRFRATLYQGTRHGKCRVQLLGDLAENTVYGQLKLDEPWFLARDDAFLLRDQAEQELLAGGKILAPDATVLRRRDKERWLKRYRALAGGGQVGAVLQLLLQVEGPLKVHQVRKSLGMTELEWEQQLPLLRDSGRIRFLSNGKLWSEDRFSNLGLQVQELLEKLQGEAPWKPGWKKEELARLLGLKSGSDSGFSEFLEEQVNLGLLQRRGPLFSRVTHQPELKPAVEKAARALETLLQGDGVSPRDWEQALAEACSGDRKMAQQLEEHLLGTGRLVRLTEKLVFAPQALDAARAVLQERAQGQAFSASEGRQWLDTSRKYIIPLLEWMDQQGWTARVGDLRQLR